ncbi:unnamed protein product [Camellia sinensis]
MIQKGETRIDIQAMVPARASNSCARAEQQKQRVTLERQNSRSSLLRPAEKILGDGNLRSSVKTPARAKKQQQRARSSVKIPART